jgi:hypothetical protein
MRLALGVAILATITVGPTAAQEAATPTPTAVAPSRDVVPLQEVATLQKELLQLQRELLASRKGPPMPERTWNWLVGILAAATGLWLFLRSRDDDARMRQAERRAQQELLTEFLKTLFPRSSDPDPKTALKAFTQRLEAVAQDIGATAAAADAAFKKIEASTRTAFGDLRALHDKVATPESVQGLQKSK